MILIMDALNFLPLILRSIISKELGLFYEDPPPLAPNKMEASMNNMRKNKQTRNGFSSESSSDANTDETTKSKRFGNRGKRDSGTPPFLNPKCDKKHCLIDCTFTSEEEKKRLNEDYFAQKIKARL